MISAIPSVKERSQPPTIKPVAETDSIPRIRVRDLLVAARFVSQHHEATLDALRVQLNNERQTRAGRTFGYSVARDVAAELDKLGYAVAGSLPKDAKAFEKKRDVKIRITDDGKGLADRLRRGGDVASAYDDVLMRLFKAHGYFRRYITAIAQMPMFAPVVTSAKLHISPHYMSARILADEVAQGKFDIGGLLGALSRRLDRPLTSDETTEIEAGMDALLKKLGTAAKQEPQTEFARKMLLAVTEVVVPAVLRTHGLGIDYNSLRRLWQMGEEFQISWATSAHPRYDGWLAFPTAQIDLSPEKDEIAGVRFESGLDEMKPQFLDRLYDAYTQMQDWELESIVTAWELRATFCFQNRCSPRVFDFLFAENYSGSEKYQIDKDFPRNKPAHETALVVGGRQIGLVRITKL